MMLLNRRDDILFFGNNSAYHTMGLYIKDVFAEGDRV